jgi:hypothetical protein
LDKMNLQPPLLCRYLWWKQTYVMQWYTWRCCIYDIGPFTIGTVLAATICVASTDGTNWNCCTFACNKHSGPVINHCLEQYG